MKQHHKVKQVGDNLSESNKKGYKSGIASREKLLDISSKVFAETGYFNAKVKDICEQAGTNPASVNYHFGGKKGLYISMWKWMYKQHTLFSNYPKSESSPEEKLRSIVCTFLSHCFSEGPEGRLSKLFLMEVFQPTGLLDIEWDKVVKPVKKEMALLFQEIYGGELSKETIALIDLSIANQCRGFFIYPINDLEKHLGCKITDKTINMLVDHITCFSIAGIKGCKNCG